jgi:hypothetical protein
MKNNFLTAFFSGVVAYGSLLLSNFFDYLSQIIRSIFIK